MLLAVATVVYFLPSSVRGSQLFLWPLLLVGMLTTIWLTLQTATKPLAKMLERISKIQDSQNLSLRVEEDESRELPELASSFNSLLNEVEQAKASQEEHRIHEDRLAVAIKGTNDGLWDWDIETGNVWYAPRFKELLGYKDRESEFADTIDSFKEHLHPDDRQTTLDAIENHIENNEEFDVEHRVRRRRRSYKWFKIRAAGVRDQAGKVIRMSGSIRDITERKRFEEAIQRSNRDLEQFAAIASHDLQEPLRKVASFCGLLQEEHSENLDETGRQYLDFAIDGAKRMSTLVQDLLRFSKIGSESGGVHQLIDSENALRLAIQNLDVSIKESGATITNGQLPKILAEPREISQLFQNLIGNAIKYRSEEAPKIQIKAKEADEFWEFSVADNGIGVKKEFRDRVFQIFQRLHSKTEYSGTGIGLAICKRVIDQLGGRIWIDSNSANGCTFCFTVPKKKSTIYDSIRLDE